MPHAMTIKQFNIIKMNNKLRVIFNFLKSNREYNKLLQERFYKSVILPYNLTKDKVISLLYHIANTQSQPKIDKLAETYKSIINDNNCLESFENFIIKINSKRPSMINFESLYYGLKKQKGWGNKTPALFTKCIYHLHNGQYSEQLKIWNDVPQTISDRDNFYLPVDAVITAIFQKLDNSKKWDFDKINKVLKENFNGQEIEVWDDLWFWGFITQNGSGANRNFEWNENKYWILKESDKNPEIIRTIKVKAEEFLSLLTDDN
jgi:hypothetical protein